MAAISAPSAPQRPRVTLVMTVRERHRLTVRAIEAVLARTAPPYRLIFAHGELPRWLDAQLEELERAGRLERRAFPHLHLAAAPASRGDERGRYRLRGLHR